MTFAVSVFLSTFVAGCLAYPSGAPGGACELMRPNHGVLPQPLDTSPFSVSINSAYYKTGESVQVTIAGNGTTEFKGILVQARPVNGTNIPVGSFLDLPANTQHLECNSNAKVYILIFGICC